MSRFMLKEVCFVVFVSQFTFIRSSPMMIISIIILIDVKWLTLGDDQVGAQGDKPLGRLLEVRPSPKT